MGVYVIKLDGCTITGRYLDAEEVEEGGVNHVLSHSSTCKCVGKVVVCCEKVAALDVHSSLKTIGPCEARYK
jgi:hypothetical protein